MHFSSAFAAAALAAVAFAQTPYLGFNTGSSKVSGEAKQKADFVAEFNTAKNLHGAPGTFNSFRLYTCVQGGTKDDPISAFEAAIETQTNLLLGIWCSGTQSIENELNALMKGVDKYGDKLAQRIIGISIGSEDLYRNSATGIANKAGVGNQPDAIAGFINDYRNKVKGTIIEKVPVGHVDTWDVYPNATNKPVIDACDWIGLDEYPFYETGKGNDIKNSYNRFTTAYNAAKAAVGGKPVWVTETGWPTSGKTWDQAVPSVENAQFYWDNVGCQSLFGKVPTFWYTLEDANPANDVKFAITSNLSTTPAFNLTCPTTFAIGPTITSGTNATNATTPNVPASSSSPGSGSGTGSGSGSGTGTSPPPSSSSTPAKNAGTCPQLLSPFAYAGLALVASVAAFL